jgi:hypothetical protein
MTTLKALTKVEIGSEVTWGTAVEPTQKLLGVTDITLVPKVVAARYPEMRGSLAPSYLAAVEEESAEGSMEMLVTYEHFVYLLENMCGTDASVTGAGPYTRDYAAPTTAAPTSPRVLTIVHGHSTNAYHMTGALVQKLTIKGDTGKPLTATADLIGKEVATGTFADPALTDDTVNVAMGSHVLLYVDAWGGTIGSTAVATTAFEFELSIDTKRGLDFHLGALTPGAYHEGAEDGWDGELKLMMEFNATSKAYLDAIIDSSNGVFQKQVRIKATTGSAGTLKTVQFDFAGMSEEAPEILTYRDGVATVELTLMGHYNPTLANWFKAQVLNGVAALA